MRGAVGLALLVVCVLPPQAAHAKCASVRLETPDGPKTFAGMILNGSKLALGRAAKAARDYGLSVQDARLVDGKYMLTIFFDDSVIDGPQALALFRRLTVGDLARDGRGTLQVNSMISPISDRKNCKK